jgi:hypothetical protein
MGATPQVQEQLKIESEAKPLNVGGADNVFKGPKNPAGVRDRSLKGVRQPSTPAATEPAASDVIAEQAPTNFAAAQQQQDDVGKALVQELPTEGAGNKLFSDVRKIDKTQSNLGPSDAEIGAAAIAGSGGSDDGDISQIK